VICLMLEFLSFSSDMDMDRDISFEEFYISLVSFERGLSYAMGLKPCSEQYLRGVASQWFSVCGFGRETEPQKGAKLGRQKFIEFCTNRHYSVRLLLEGFASATFPVVVAGDTTSRLVASSSDYGGKHGGVPLEEPGGGDEWLANPPWKKTAEKMTPKGCPRNPDKPEANLCLDWVHGYRGFDSRNNVRYASPDGSHFLFYAGALGIVQSIPDVDSSEAATQVYFGEHQDDVTCLAVCGEGGEVLAATGNMGKDAAIHLWVPYSEGRASNSQSIACMVGSHPKGVSHLAFSLDGALLFSVGVEYTIAVYNVKRRDAKFGKLVASVQGPKGIALHACASGDNAAPEFVSCGEKHVVFWKVVQGAVRMEPVQLGALKNKVSL
jgi:hypothetical protein